MNTKKFLTVVLLGIGILSFVVGGLVVWGKRAEAASQNYSETYNAIKWRTAHFTDVYGSDRPFSLGPSSWHIVGDYGSSHYDETWQANSWETPAAPGPVTSSCSYSETNSPVYFQYGDGETMTGALYPAGLYGSIFSDGRASQGCVSYPKGWTITGTVTTP